MPGSGSRSTPVLLGGVLTSICFVATGGEIRLGALLAGFVVPTLLRTYLVVERRRAAGEPFWLLSSLDAFLASAALSTAFNLWLLVVAAMTSSLKSIGLAFLPGLTLFGLAIWLVHSLVEHGTFEPAWRRLFRVRFTVRGMFVVVALLALALWPVHLWRMRATYDWIANHEAIVAVLCEVESEFMAERAEQCRGRAYQGAAWDLEDEDSQALKICPYPDDGPGDSWLAQEQIWERAAERARLAAGRHRWTSAWHEPWVGPSRAR